MSHVKWKTIPSWRRRYETFVVGIALLIAAVLVVSTTLAPNKASIPSESTKTDPCTINCGTETHDTEIAEAAQEAIEEDQAPIPSTPARTANDVAESETKELDWKLDRPETTTATHTREDQEPADEPITTRPVADRFDFINPAIDTTLANLEDPSPRQQFANLPTTNLRPVAPSHVSEVKTATHELEALPTEALLPAIAKQATQPEASATRVAGWRLIRTIDLGELTETEAESGANIQPLPIRKPDVPEGYVTKPIEAIVTPAQTRRARRRTNYSNAPNKPKSQPKPAGSNNSWQNEALFKDN